MVELNLPLLSISVILPFVVGAIELIGGRRSTARALAYISAAALAPALITSVFLPLWAPGAGVVDPLRATIPLVGTLALYFDPFSVPFAIGIAVVTLAVTAYSHPYMTKRIEELAETGAAYPPHVYYFLYLVFAASMLGAVLSANAIVFYLFIELALIPSFVLIALYGYGERVRIAIMYLIWTHIGALLFLVGVILPGYSAGTFDVIDPRTGAFAFGFGEALPSPLREISFWAVVAGLFIKMAAFGVHIWLPYAHAEAPTPISALLSPNLIGISAYGLIRFAYVMFPSTFLQYSLLFVAWALITIIYGGMLALVQSDFKRMLAYSSISQMGYLLLGLSSLTPFGAGGAALHYLSHAVGKAVLFMVAGVIITQAHGLRDITKMGGFAQRMPITASLALLGFMAITGIPPTLGLWSEVMIVLGVINKFAASWSALLPLLIAALVFAITLSAAYAYVTFKRVFLGKLPPEAHEIKEGGESLLVPIALIAAVGVIVFFTPSFIVEPLVAYLKMLGM